MSDRSPGSSSILLPGGEWETPFVATSLNWDLQKGLILSWGPDLRKGLWISPFYQQIFMVYLTCKNS